MKLFGQDISVIKNQFIALYLNIRNWTISILPFQTKLITYPKTNNTCISINGPGGLEQLKYIDNPHGIASAGYNLEGVQSPFINLSISNDIIYSSTNILIKTAYFSVNYADIAIRWGLYESALRYVGWPIVPGFDFSGTVIWAGKDTPYKINDKVFGFTMFGAYSSHILVPHSQIRCIPNHIDMSVAAAIPAVTGTALHALHLAGGWNPLVLLNNNDINNNNDNNNKNSNNLNDSNTNIQNLSTSLLVSNNKAVLIHSAAGGVGSMLIQVCKLAGYHPIVAIVGASHKVNVCKDLGADIVIDKSKIYNKQLLYNEIVKASGYNNYIAIFDANGVESIQQSYELLTQCGKLIIYGFHSNLPKAVHSLSPYRWIRMVYDMIMMPKFDPMLLVLESKAVIGFNLSFFADEKKLIELYMNQIVIWMSCNKLKVAKVTIMEMKDIAIAHQQIQTGQSIGKIVMKCP